MRIGTLQQTQRNRVNFKTWIKEYWKHGENRELKIIRIFLPAKFNNFTLICYDEFNNLEVSRTLNTDLGKKMLKEFKFSVKIPRQGTLYLKIDSGGEQDIVEKTDEDKVYIFEKNSFVLRDVNTIPIVEDDIPF
jgi:hypothetical protein